MSPLQYTQEFYLTYGSSCDQAISSPGFFCPSASHAVRDCFADSGPKYEDYSAALALELCPPRTSPSPRKRVYRMETPQADEASVATELILPRRLPFETELPEDDDEYASAPETEDDWQSAQEEPLAEETVEPLGAGSLSPLPSLEHTQPAKPTDFAPDEIEELLHQDLKADGTPKRPMNAWIIYRKCRTKQLKRSRARIKTSAVSGIASREWNRLTDEQRAPWDDLEELVKTRFDARWPKYKYQRSPSSNTESTAAAQASSNKCRKLKGG